MTNDQQAIETPALLSVAQRSVSLRPQGRLITHYSLSGRAAHRRAGMILLLVIALLVLLALMGTVFILMASTDRKSAYASNSSASLNMAQQGVLNTVRGLMLNQTLDQSNGTYAVGQYYPLATTTPPFEPAGYVPNQYSVAQGTTGQIGRYWDYPEIGPISSTPATSSDAQFYQSVIVQGANAPPVGSTVPPPTQYAPSEPWLVSTLPYEPFSNYAPGERVYFCSPDATYPNAPDQVLPASRAVNIYIYGGTANTVGSESPPGTGAWTLDTDTSQVAVPTGEKTPFGAAGTVGGLAPPISCLSPYLYDPSTGAYDIGYSDLAPAPLPGSGGTVVVPNASVVEPRWQFYSTNNPQLTKLGSATDATGPDAMWNLLPYSDPNGTRYRFAVRIVDTSAMLNLNTGWIANAYASAATNTAEAADQYAKCGAFIASAQILNAPNLDIDNLTTFVSGAQSYTDYTYAAQNGSPAQLGSGPTNPTTAGRTGRYGSYTPAGTFYSLPVWQGILNDYEQQYPTNGPPGYFSSTSPPAPYTTALFGTNTEMDLLTGGGAGGAPFGSPTYSRLATLMPNTFGLPFAAVGNYFGSGYRSLYTDYSWSRDYEPVTINTAKPPAGAPQPQIDAVDALQQIGGPMGATAYPRLDLNNTTPSQTFCTQLYEMLVDCGFSYPHAAAYVVNYLAYLDGNGGVGTTADTTQLYEEPPIIQYVANPPAGQYPGEYLQDPAIPSSMATKTSAGWPMYCMAGGWNNVPVGQQDQNTYVGLTAQPFLNEIEVQIKTKPSAAGQSSPTITHWTLELMNPFPGANNLSLIGWKVLVNGTVTNGNISVGAGGVAVDLGQLTSTQPTGGPLLGIIGPYGNASLNYALVLSDAGDTMTSLAPPPKAGSPPETPVVVAGLPSIPLSGTIELVRPVPNIVNTQNAAPTLANPEAPAYQVVDVMSYNFSGLAYTASSTNTNWYADVQRDNGSEWSCASAPPLPAQMVPGVGQPYQVPLTLAQGGPGVNNTQPSLVPSQVAPLFDRIYAGAVYDGNDGQIAPLDTTGFINLDDFNCIARETNSVDAATGTVETIAGQIDSNAPYTTPSTAPVLPASYGATGLNVFAYGTYANQNNGMTYVTYAATKPPTQYPVFSGEASDAALYFDFAYDPRAADSAATQTPGYPMDPVLAQNGGVIGEMSPNILSMVSVTYRPTTGPAGAALPEGATDLIRLPGKININTAGPDVLYSAFSDDGALWNGAAPTATSVSNLVDAAIGFRDRLPAGVAVPIFTSTGTAGSTSATTTMTMATNPSLTFNYNGQGYPGTGFRTRADLLTAMLPIIDTAGTLYTGSLVPTTLQQRDAAWADVANFLTVRSDTFAVYGLVQALRLNPVYNAAVAAGTAPYYPTDWYNANQGITIGAGPTEYSISTDPTNQNAEFILEGSRRFIAIVDRSYCNNGAVVQPHIVALKILPQ